MAREPWPLRAMLRAFCGAGVCATVVALSGPAAACPRCAEGMLARAAVLREDFGRNFAFSVLPFLIIGAVCARVEGIGRPRAPSKRSPASTAPEPEPEAQRARPPEQRA